MYIYPALKLKMGSWDYFVVRMTMTEAAREIKFATELRQGSGGDESLDGKIQRILKEKRSDQIVEYLQTNHDRFFNSLVVAALDGNPRFTPVKIEDTPELVHFRDHLTGAFGALSFGDDLEIYALDGQHRLKAIKMLSEDGTPGQDQMRETISVIFVTQDRDTPRSEFLKSHRRLFSALNRNAKPTDTATNIIMDEDDRFAIASRRMISSHEFFQWVSSAETPPRIDLDAKSENMHPSNNSLTSIIGFYKWNIELLWDEDFSREYGPNSGQNFKKLLQKTPADDEIDELYDYLARIWNSLTRTLPELENEGSKMRADDPNDAEQDAGYQNNLLFRPVGQSNIVGRLARRMMTDSGINKNSSEEEIMDSLKPLKLLPWDLHHPLYKYLLITNNESKEGRFKMRDDGRTKCVAMVYKILMWLSGLEDLDQGSIDKLQEGWGLLLLPNTLGPKYEEDVWKELSDLRLKILAS